MMTVEENRMSSMINFLALFKFSLIFFLYLYLVLMLVLNF